MAKSKRDRQGKQPSAFLRGLRERLRRLSGRLPLPEDGGEPIDFSSPSIPYYRNLAERFSLARIILYLALFVFVVTALLSNRHLLTYSNLYYLVKDINAAALTAQDMANTLEYPASQSTPAFAAYRGGLVVAGSDEVTVLNGAGKKTLSKGVSYGSPAVAVSDKYFLTYGLGERSFALYNAFSQVYGEDTEYPVYGAAVADDGSFAVLTRSQTYTSEVIFYDRDMNRLAAYHLGGYATSLALNPSGETAAILSVDSQDGLWSTKISLIRVSDRMTENSVQTVTLTGTFGGVCDFVAEDRVAAVLSDRLLILRPDGEILSETVFDGLIPTLCTIGAGRVAVLSEKSTDLSEKDLKVFDKSGKIVYNRSIDWDGSPTAMAFGGYTLYVRTATAVYRLSPDGRELSYAPINRDAVCILPDEDGNVLVCGTAYATRLRQADFTASASN